ncbi:uncharacterized protein LOC131167509 isoform X2 [Malania oleifera]|uniref:uncharacterized protein LOC131167509 isoform X2 n=1 Tax=Malania oleifera TaxID=397392 RepID=UPI0025AE901F|nr:uncharacterized protein LOC131167509 isoform X2 [Malania oleifera]
MCSCVSHPQLGFFHCKLRSVLITSTILITLAKKRNSLADQNAEDVNMLELESEERLCLDELGCDSQEKPAQQSETCQPRDVTSELELSCVMVNENANDQSPVSSDGSSDDDENDDGLIEIALPIPDGDFVDSSEESDRESHSNSRDILPEAGFQQESLMELLAEINEEENLFEIDISPFYDPSNVHDLRLKHD